MRRHVLTLALLLTVIVTLYPAREQAAVPALGGGGLFTESAILDISQVEHYQQPTVRIGRRGR